MTSYAELEDRGWLSPDKAKAVIAAERERCAKIALEQGRSLGEAAIGFAIAQAINANK